MPEESEVNAEEVEEVVEDDEGEDELSAERHAELLRELASCQAKTEAVQSALVEMQKNQAGQQPEAARALTILDELRTQNQTILERLESYRASIPQPESNPSETAVVIVEPSEEIKEGGRKEARTDSTTGRTDQPPSSIPPKKKRYVRV